jgi:hypothetical protein
LSIRPVARIGTPSVCEVDVNATVLDPRGFVRSLRIHLAARSRCYLFATKSSTNEERSYAVGSTAAECDVVLLAAAGIGMANEAHLPRGEWPGGEAAHELVECRIVDTSDACGVECEMRVRVRDSARATNVFRDIDD